MVKIGNKTSFLAFTQGLGSRIHFCWVLWHRPLISAFVEWKQEDQEFNATLSYTVSSSPGWAT